MQTPKAACVTPGFSAKLGHQALNSISVVVQISFALVDLSHLPLYQRDIIPLVDLMNRQEVPKKNAPQGITARTELKFCARKANMALTRGCPILSATVTAIPDITVILDRTLRGSTNVENRLSTVLADRFPLRQ